MDGWIKSYRSVMDNPIVCKDADHYAVWGYIMHYAAHAASDSVFNGRRITLQPGQLITGRQQIARKFKISESKVYRVLKSFKIEQQIEQQTSNVCSLISVVNWDKYQSTEQQDEQQLNNDRTATEQQVNTIQEDKKIRTNKKEKGKSDLKTPSDKEKSCAKKEESTAFEKFRRWISDNTPNVGRMKEPFTEDEFVKLKQDFPLDRIQETLRAMHNWKPLLTKNVNANLTFRRWAQKDNYEKRTTNQRANSVLDKAHRDTAFADHIAAKMRSCEDDVSNLRSAAPEF